MSDLTGRLLVVLGVLAVAAVAGLVAGRRAGRRRVHWPGLGGVVLFTATGCDGCEQARSALEAVGVGFTRVPWEERPDLFDLYRIERVPTIGSVDAGGRGWAVEGVPAAVRLRRWLNP